MVQEVGDRQFGSQLWNAAHMVDVVMRDYQIVNPRQTGDLGRFGYAICVAVVEPGIDE
jgi:hypothetical protein